MNNQIQRTIFFVFFLSGFSGLAYQVVWIRLAYASFGVITPVLSVVISIFMAGLAIGSWVGGKSIIKLTKRTKKSALSFYSMTELLIGIGAFLVPKLFAFGDHYLQHVGEINSSQYLLFSALVISISLLPWCILMGLTFPFMMAFIREIHEDNGSSFSLLYLANVLGGVCGTLFSALFLIELVGFNQTVLIAAIFNWLAALISFLLARRGKHPGTTSRSLSDSALSGKMAASNSVESSNLAWVILFLTGLTSMSMEVIWTRAYTGVLGTRTYSFAALLTIYLFATWIGSYRYRSNIQKGKIISTESLLAIITVSILLPILLNDPRIHSNQYIILVSIVPFCAFLGYLTPKLIDDYSGGEPERAGRAYAVNIVGCIVGPLCACYLLLPRFGINMSLILLVIPYLILCLFNIFKRRRQHFPTLTIAFIISVIFLAIGYFVSYSYEEKYASLKGTMIRRDHTATVISVGTGLHKNLLVNGIGITTLTSDTKVMAHMPLAFYSGQPKSALTICFGMGTTYRSLLSWDIEATAVELVPSVVDVFGFYFEDADELMKHPKGKIIIDDGRRFLRRTITQYDVVTIDPPPPLEAAGSSLLYSEEFYDLLKKRLTKRAILHQWAPFGDLSIIQAITRSLYNSFPHVIAYKSIEGWGVHFFASMAPIKTPTASEVVTKLPQSAKSDLVEWKENVDVNTMVSQFLERKILIADLLNDHPEIRIIDDKPFNEYYILRRWLFGGVN